MGGVPTVSQPAADEVGPVARRLTALWPGLARLWYDGDAHALALALAAAALLVAALAASLVWTEVLPRAGYVTVWGAVAAVWAGSAVLSVRWWRRRAASRADKNVHLFRRALDQYLQGHWVEAEGLLGRLLSVAPHDGDARLLLATLLRHTRRYEQARDQLQRLLGCPGHEKWEFELRRELALLDDSQAEEAQAVTDHAASATDRSEATPDRTTRPQAA